MSVLQGAIFQGIGAAGNTYADALLKSEMQRRDRDERALERRREFEDRAELQRELQAERLAAGGGGGKKSGGVLMDPAREEEYLAMSSGMNTPDLQRFRTAEKTGDYSGYEVEQTQEGMERDANGRGPGAPETRRVLPPDFEAFKARKRAEIARSMENVYFSGDVDKLAKGRQTDVETGVLKDAAKGDRTAQETLLLSKGKDPLETAARAEKAGAEADLKNRTDPNRPRGGGSGGGAGGLKVRATRVGDNGNIVLVMSDGSLKDTGMKDASFGKAVGAMIAKLSKDDYKFSKLPDEEKRRRVLDLISSGSSEAPAASPSPAPAPAPKPAAAPDQKAAAAIKARFQRGELTREQAVAELRKLGFK